MGYFTVLKPCVVGKLHYATVPSQPIEVDDDVAAPLVADGSLQLYPKPAVEPPQGEPAPNPFAGLGDMAANVRFVSPPAGQPEVDKPARPRNPRRTKA